jgi:hypothetical protein
MNDMQLMTTTPPLADGFDDNSDDGGYAPIISCDVTKKEHP